MHFPHIYKLMSSMALCLFTITNVCAAPQEQVVSLSSKDGWALSAVYLPSAKSTTVALLHDLGKSKGEFSSFRKALAKAGFGYVALDLRGHGQSTGKGSYKSFAKEGAEQGLINLKGHRSVGGMRASIYNAMPYEGVEKLVAFMKAFAESNPKA